MNSKRQNLRKRRGLALVLVICMMALAAVLGYAMLSSATLQATAASNGQRAAVADYEAQTGIQLAMYYLLNPTRAPSSATSNGVTYWPGGNNITYSSPASSASYVSVSVTPLAVVNTTYPNTFTVVATGYSNPTSDSLSVSRTVTATIQVASNYSIAQPGTFNSAVTVKSGMNFSNANTSMTAIESGTSVTLNLGSIINGNISAPSINQILGAILNGLQKPGPSTSTPAPATANLFKLSSSNQYLYNGAWYTATQIATPASNKTLGATGSNPLGVYYAPANLTLSGNVNISGTLVVQNSGQLVVSGTGNTITPITSTSNQLPAIVVNNSSIELVSGAKLTASGVVFAENGVIGLGVTTSASLNITGALLADGGGNFTNYSGGVTVSFDPTNPLISVPNLSSSSKSVKLLSWSQ